MIEQAEPSGAEPPGAEPPGPQPPSGEPHVWQTLGYRRGVSGPGEIVVEWDAPVGYTFPTAGGRVVQGGLVTAQLDAAMGGACWSVLDADQVFLTADLRVEFLRPARPGLLRATGTIVRRTRRVIFCAADLTDADGLHIAASRCTQVVLPADADQTRRRPPSAPWGDGG